MSHKSNITLNKIFNHMEKNEQVKVIQIGDSVQIYDLQKIKMSLSNKDYRLLNDLANDYVDSNYPLFQNDLAINQVEVINNIFGLSIKSDKLKSIKPFKKIVKKKLIVPTKTGAKTITVIRQRTKS